MSAFGGKADVNPGLDFFRRPEILMGCAMLRTLTSRDLFSVVAIVVLAAFGTVLVSRNLPMVQAGENWLAEPAPTTM
jgi:hypothetical protein